MQSERFWDSKKSCIWLYETHSDHSVTLTHQALNDKGLEKVELYLHKKTNNYSEMYHHSFTYLQHSKVCITHEVPRVWH
jgi:hypothetical protein